MFTGLVNGIAKIQKLLPEDSDRMARLFVENALHYEFKFGDSIAVNGCCLTATSESTAETLVFEVSRETLDKTNLGSQKTDDFVNLEQAMRMSDRLDGHMVSGHIDTTCTVTQFEASTSGWFLQVAIAREYAQLVIPKGSICLNGVSLTVNKLVDEPARSLVEFMLIPTTLEKTNLKDMGVSSVLNIEFDLVGKYILRSSYLNH